MDLKLYMIIIAAVGLKTYSEESVKKIILAGADAIRYSFNYGTIEQNIEHIKDGIKIIDELNSSAKVIANLPSNKVRLVGSIKPREVNENDEITLCSASPEVNDEQIIQVDTKNLAQKVYVNQITTIDHGKIAIQIFEILNNDTIKAKVLNHGLIQATHGINLIKDAGEDKYLEKCKMILDKLGEAEPQLISIPFVNVNTNVKIKNLSKYEWKPKIMVRVEDREGVENLELICQDPFYDMILINRGELGVALPFERLGTLQKEMIGTIKKHKKQVIISSQIIEGTINNYIPMRSDILDLTNIVLDGADCIMLCHETALSTRPAYTLSVAKKIIIEVEKYKSQFYCKL